MPKLVWVVHWLGTVELQHLKWQEPVCVTDVGSSPEALGASEIGSELELGYLQFCTPLRGFVLESEEDMGFAACAVTSHALALCHQSLAGPVPRHYSACKNRVWHQSASKKLVRRAGPVTTFQDT